ncbi:chloride channel protein 2-like isoform X2 [Tubulanus polymorphus]|uniref:chloride channel protein 2-like isoform X2 n=1 Tax=Tubulanus polymorphus TaxID=672921 RepID=UPI003DA2AE7B
MTENKEDDRQFGYEQTLMYGRYTRDLSEFAREQAAQLQREREQDETSSLQMYKKWKLRCPSYCRTCLRGCNFVISKIGEDWLFLAILGVLMAVLSFVMDFAISHCQMAQRRLFYEVRFSESLQFFSWIAFPLVLILFSAGFVHLVAPNAIGSGIPEMKTIMRGVVLKEYLTFRTLISKMVGLTSSLGSGMPMGKEGPFVHVASIVATLLSKLVTSFRGMYENESRHFEMLAAACAVGVACTFAAPIGGVLFSIEVTATYFAVRNYWRGFFSAVCGALTFRLLAVWFKNEITVSAVFKTYLRHDVPFDVLELVAFAVIGVVTGVAGAMFVLLHRHIVFFMRSRKKLSKFLQKNRFMYPAFVTLVISSLSCPIGVGKFTGGELTYHKALEHLFSNFTWSANQVENVAQEEILDKWKPPGSNIYITLAAFSLFHFFFGALANTLPVPAGVFIPVFAIGAAFGRLVGECMATWFPNGLNSEDGHLTPIVPGGYAVVGAAALAGSATHTISTAVIAFEMTGQIGHILPTVIAVLISNAIATALMPSIYDSIIQIKRLPFLPDITTRGQQNMAHLVFVEDIMVKSIKFVSFQSTYQEIKDLLSNYRYRGFPFVDSPKSMILLGSIQRAELERILRSTFGVKARRSFVDLPSLDTPTMSDTAAANPAPSGKSEPTKANNNSDDGATKKLLTRKPSRFAVTKAKEDPIKLPDQREKMIENFKLVPETASRWTIHAGMMNQARKDSVKRLQAKRKGPGQYVRSLSAQELLETEPKKSILKNKTPDGSPVSTPVQEKKFRIGDSSDAGSESENEKSSQDVTLRVPKRLKLPPARVMDLTKEEQVAWELALLKKPVDFNNIQIDPAPFQLVERTSLYKVHSMFALLNLHHAYVTNTGRLVGVVALAEVRNAVAGETSKFYDRGADQEDNLTRPVISINGTTTDESDVEAGDIRFVAINDEEMELNHRTTHL